MASHLTAQGRGAIADTSVTVDGTDHADAAWYHPAPSPLARTINGRVAFDRRVRVER